MRNRMISHDAGRLRDPLAEGRIDSPVASVILFFYKAYMGRARGAQVAERFAVRGKDAAMGWDRTNGTSAPAGPDWNKTADMYDSFVFCELEDTSTYLDAIGIRPEDSVLDVCCGPGRISILAAERCARVTGIDSAQRMLEKARGRAAERGVTNVTFRLMDWNNVLPGQNVERHDVVIASRCGAIMDVEKLSALVTRTAAVQIFADAPSIPQLQESLFSGCGEPLVRPGMGARPGQPGGPGAPGDAQAAPGGRQGMYFRIVQRAYEAGFDPNVRILPERFRKTFESRDEAVAWICALNPQRSEGNEDRVAFNAEPFFTDTDDGVEFCIATAAAIIWWNANGRASWGCFA